MDSKSLLVAWRHILPATVSVDAGALLEDARPLTARELASAGRVESLRMRELQSGRVYAKRALRMLGMNHIEIPNGEDRPPVWPTGIVGSLSNVSVSGVMHFV